MPSFQCCGEKRRGFDDTRGTLFFEIARLASVLRPRLYSLKTSEGSSITTEGIRSRQSCEPWDGLGYDLEWQVLNSKDYLPKSRRQVFIIGHSRGTSFTQVFPFKEKTDAFLVQKNKFKDSNVKAISIPLEMV